MIITFKASTKIEDMEAVEPFINLSVDFPSKPLIDTWLNNNEMDQQYKPVVLDCYFNVCAWLREYLNCLCDDSFNVKDTILLERLEQLYSSDLVLSKLLRLVPSSYQPPCHHYDESKFQGTNPMVKSSSKTKSNKSNSTTKLNKTSLTQSATQAEDVNGERLVVAPSESWRMVQRELSIGVFHRFLQMEVSLNGNYEDKLSLKAATYIHVHLNTVLSYKFNMLKIGLANTNKIGRNWVDVISLNAIGKLVLEMVPQSFNHLKLAADQLESNRETGAGQLVFSIISWLKVVFAWVMDSDDGMEFHSQFIGEIKRAFDKPLLFFSSLTNYLSNSVDLKCLMEIIRRLAAEFIEDDRSSQNELLYDTTWKLLKHPWLKTSQPALLECIKSLLSFAPSKLDTIEKLYDCGIKPVIDSRAAKDTPETLSISKGNVAAVYKMLFNELLRIARRNCTVTKMKKKQRFLKKWNEIGHMASKLTRALFKSTPKMMGQGMLTGRVIIELYVKNTIGVLIEASTEDQESYGC